MSEFDDTETCLWYAEAERFDRMLEPYGEALLEAAALRSGDHVLDVGCGAGATTLQAADRVGSSGAATGIDLSPQLVALARRRGSGRGNVTFTCADAANHPYAATHSTPSSAASG